MNRSSGKSGDRAVSPVIGVILMVAITVILAAVVGTFALDLGDEVQTNPQASVSFSEDGSDVTVRVQSVQRADSISVEGDCGNAPLTPESGAQTTLTCSNPGDTVTVSATYEGHEVLIQTYDYKG